MNFGNLLRGAVQSYGRNVMWNQENDARQADLALKQQRVEQGAAELAMKQEQQASYKRIGEQIAAAQAADASSVSNPMKQAAIWQKASTSFAAAGNLEGADRAASLAATFTSQARQATLDLAKQTQMAKESLSTAALDYSTNPTAEGAAAVARAAVAAGENPLEIPQPATPEFKAWVKAKSLAALSGAERVKHLEGEAEFAAKREDAKERHEDLQEERRARRAQTAAIQAGLSADRAARLEERREARKAREEAAAGNGKPLPVGAVKLQQAELEAIGVGASIATDLGAIKKQVDEGELKLGPIENLVAEGRNLTNNSTSSSRNYATFKTTLEKLRNDSLRLNKGVQTEGDSERAWKELLGHLTDKLLVSKRLGEIQKLNQRAVELRKLNVNSIRQNYGAAPLDTTDFENQPAVVGNGEVPAAVGAGKSPAGVDPELWSHLTPEERKLWK